MRRSSHFSFILRLMILVAFLLKIGALAYHFSQAHAYPDGASGGISAVDRCPGCTAAKEKFIKKAPVSANPVLLQKPLKIEPTLELISCFQIERLDWASHFDSPPFHPPT